MTDMEIKSISARLDMICKNFYEQTELADLCEYGAWCKEDISGKLDLIEKMVDDLWFITKKNKLLDKEIDAMRENQDRMKKMYKEMLRKAENESSQEFMMRAQAEDKVLKLEKLLHEYQDKALEQELLAYTGKKTKRYNQNARRKDISATEVYQLVKGGMSITKVAEKFHASRQTIRKYYIAGENECFDYENNV